MKFNLLKNIKIILATTLILSTNLAHAGLIDYSITGIIEDERSSTKIRFGGDRDVMSTTNDGSNFTFNFKLDDKALPSISSSYFTYSDYWLNDSFEFLINGEIKKADFARVRFGDHPSKWQHFSFDVFFNSNPIDDIDRIFFSLYGNDIFNGDLSKPTLLNQDNYFLDTANGHVGLFEIRVLDANATAVPEPSIIAICLLGFLALYIRR